MPPTTPQPKDRDDAAVIVVGAGPAGSATAYHLARAGVDVLLLEKAEFPREKVCGDGLTPRAVHQLIRMGVDVDGPGWTRSRGMRWVAGGRSALIEWPRLGRYPDFGLTRTRHDFDDLLARHAVGAGARLRTGTKVTGALTDRAGRVIGVRAQVGPERTESEYRARVVVAADGASARLALGLGLRRDERQPIATAARRYYRSPQRSQEEYLELWADLRLPGTDRYLPGYGWIFPMGDGRVNVGLGALPNRRNGTVDLRATMDHWLARTPAHWGLRPGEGDAAEGQVLSAALPLGFNRHPQYGRGLLLVGDSGGMVSPWNGEGIAQALEAGEVAAEAVAMALTVPDGPAHERALGRYPVEMSRRWGRHYRLGNVLTKHVFSRAGFQPLLNGWVMGSPAVLDGMARLLVGLTDDPPRDRVDRVLGTLLRLVPEPKPSR
ncbi:geranylgeranyl reductase family protein [Streptomyces sp. PTM05]|uniref:Geranylgeranyl reductase family protein n=1 Tax=Streptantibioticus parmotrematis TaxID=2873249 RepID=A0ABS7QR00_9ACTN|nr:geranylgeranyl reductase family protein [Streptantibioticus parmotrematis]MBY8885094.1 geranylgeranyl reductase family protein [Streptantibioticus parmotrematis]